MATDVWVTVFLATDILASNILSTDILATATDVLAFDILATDILATEILATGWATVWQAYWPEKKQIYQTAEGWMNGLVNFLGHFFEGLILTFLEIPKMSSF